ncbi:MAG: (Fe-S)-binding protein [Chloroflexota bacterium]
MTIRRKMAIGLAAGAAVGLAASKHKVIGRGAERLRVALSGGAAMESPVVAGEPVAFPDKELLRVCVHCGLCLPFCPTYKALNLEADSPRGRIYQMIMVAKGLVAPDDPNFRLHMFRCLDCRACETACPSGVQYGRLIEAARSLIPPANTTERLARRFVLDGLLDSPALLKVAGTATRLYQRSGLQKVVRATGALRVVPPLRRMESMLPKLVGSLVDGDLPAFVPAEGLPRYRVALLRGCVASQFFPQTNRSTVAVLAANGCDVYTPSEQGCCGALQNHSGDREAALAMARHNIDVFERVDPDFIITNSAGCGSMMKEYGFLLADDPDYAARGAAFAARVRDVTELLALLPLVAPTHAVKRRVAYQDACHLGHGQKVKEQPRQVLRGIPGLDLVDLPQSDWCCGSAGIYNVTQPALSEEILGWKLANIAGTGADTVVASNPGCLLQIEHGLRERGLAVRTAHPIDLLAEAYGFKVR